MQEMAENTLVQRDGGGNCLNDVWLVEEGLP